MLNATLRKRIRKWSIRIVATITPVLMIHAKYDKIVPATTGDALYLSMGKPERWSYRTGRSVRDVTLENQTNLSVARTPNDEPRAGCHICPANRRPKSGTREQRASDRGFDAYLTGYGNMSVYDGRWREWSANRSNPIAVGAPRGEIRQRISRSRPD